jgi:hypothetical protein
MPLFGMVRKRERGYLITYTSRYPYVCPKDWDDSVCTRSRCPPNDKSTATHQPKATTHFQLRVLGLTYRTVTHHTGHFSFLGYLPYISRLYSPLPYTPINSGRQCRTTKSFFHTYTHTPCSHWNSTSLQGFPSHLSSGRSYPSSLFVPSIQLFKGTQQA